jgi:RNA polymerase sigma-70 factor (ECF subfamily)
LPHIRGAERGDRGSIAELVELVRTEEHIEAAEALIGACGAPALMVVRRILKDGPDTDATFWSAAQIAIERIDQLREPGSFGAWFTRIAERQAYNASRRRLREREHAGPMPDGFLDRLAVKDNEPFSELFSDRVAAALVSLSPFRRRVTVLHLAFGWSEKDLVEYFEGMVALGTIRSNIARGRKHLRAALEGDLR